MTFTRALALVAVAVTALLGALPAAGKEGVTAILTTPLRLDAAPGTKLTIGWTLGFRDDHGKRQRFGGGGIFVRLIGVSGSRQITFAHPRADGGYAATVRVPKDGIRRLQIGIRGSTDVLFPIASTPLVRTR